MDVILENDRDKQVIPNRKVNTVLLESEARARMNNEVTLYTSTMCPVCGMVKDYLAHLNIEYKEINIDLRPIEMIKLIGKTRRFSVPQTNIDGEWISGFDPVLMLEVINAKTK